MGEKKGIKKVLIIENQYLQFQQLQRALSSDSLRIKIDVQPGDKDSFIRLVAAAKVFLDNSYDETYRNECLELILNMVGGGDSHLPVDLIIIDYKLGGSSVSSDGIDLANKIWEVYYSIPVLFLSREDPTRKEILFKERPIKFKHKWLMKGFLGEDSLAEDYIQYVVFNEIVRLTTTSEEDFEKMNASIIDDIEYILSKLRVENIDKEVWEDLLKYLRFSYEPLPTSIVQEIKTHRSDNNSIVDRSLSDSIYEVIHRTTPKIGIIGNDE